MGNELDCCACCQKRGGRGETNWLLDCRFYESEPIWESVQEGKLTKLRYQGGHTVLITAKIEEV